jgi:ferrous iron transport protein B
MNDEKIPSQNENRQLSTPPIILIGNANVGKSVIFSLLTRAYAAVSNYPGTTVELLQGVMEFRGIKREVIDTPGVADFAGRSEDERVARDVVFSYPEATTVLVVDVKNLARGLYLALFLSALGRKMVIVLNMIDEAEHRGIEIDFSVLERLFNVPVVPMVAVKGVGFEDLLDAIEAATPSSYFPPLSSDLAAAVSEVEECFLPEQPDRKGAAIVALCAPERFECETFERSLLDCVDKVGKKFCVEQKESFPAILASSWMQVATDIAKRSVKQVVLDIKPAADRFLETLGNVAIQPVAGLFIAIAVLVAMFLFVGMFGAGFLVDFIGQEFFDRFIIPASNTLLNGAPLLLKDFFIGPYGVITMAVAYAFGIILPITTTFFFFFALLEDSGYLPRISVLADRVAKLVGVSGRAVIPMLLGLGCGTMATLSTRILESAKERFIATFLLALAVPCSAQLGVTIGILGGISFAAVAVWVVTILFFMVVVGTFLDRIIRGDELLSVIEIPPLRRPGMRNVFLKTGHRVSWYMKEVLPIFLFGSVILFLCDLVGIMKTINTISGFFAKFLGLPFESGIVFVTGFFRRDYGAAMLYNLFQKGLLSVGQTVIAAVVFTLFIPCCAQFFLMVRERGLKTALMIATAVFFLAIIAGKLVGILIHSLSLFGGVA